MCCCIQIELLMVATGCCRACQNAMSPSFTNWPEETAQCATSRASAQGSRWTHCELLVVNAQTLSGRQQACCRGYNRPSVT